MTRPANSIVNQMLSVLSLIALTFLIAGAGCTDSGSTVGPGDDGGNDTNTVELISFASDVFPIFQGNCAGSGCHIGGNSNGLSLSSYATLMAGTSFNGPVVIPEDAENSHLIKRLEGRVSPQMPFGRPPLADSLIARIRDWIDQGALDN